MISQVTLIVLYALLDLINSSLVFDELSQDNFYVRKYCPETRMCPEGTHVYCSHYDDKHKTGRRCDEYEAVKMSANIIQTFLNSANRHRGDAASGRIKDTINDKLYPKAYGMIKLQWDHTLAEHAQIHLNQCPHQVADVCRSTAKFPDAGQDKIRRTWWYDDNYQSEALIIGRVEVIMYKMRRQVDFYYGRFANVQAHPQDIPLMLSTATHIGCGLSLVRGNPLPIGFEEYSNRVLLYAMGVCNFSHRLKPGQKAYSTVHPGERFTKECGCPRGYKESSDCLCVEDEDFVPSSSTEPVFVVRPGYNKLTVATLKSNPAQSIYPLKWQPWKTQLTSGKLTTMLSIQRQIQSKNFNHNIKPYNVENDFNGLKKYMKIKSNLRLDNDGLGFKNDNSLSKEVRHSIQTETVTKTYQTALTTYDIDSEFRDLKNYMKVKSNLRFDNEWKEVSLLKDVPQLYRRYVGETYETEPTNRYIEEKYDEYFDDLVWAPEYDSISNDGLRRYAYKRKPYRIIETEKYKVRKSYDKFDLNHDTLQQDGYRRSGKVPTSDQITRTNRFWKLPKDKFSLDNKDNHAVFPMFVIMVHPFLSRHDTRKQTYIESLRKTKPDNRRNDKSTDDDFSNEILLRDLYIRNPSIRTKIYQKIKSDDKFNYAFLSQDGQQYSEEVRKTYRVESGSFDMEVNSNDKFDHSVWDKNYGYALSRHDQRKNSKMRKIYKTDQTNNRFDEEFRTYDYDDLPRDDYASL